MLIKTTIHCTKSPLLLRLSLLLFIATHGLSAQVGLNPPPGSANDASAIPSTSAAGQSTDAIGGQTALTTQQILRLLQQKPELTVELKSLSADQLTQHGAPTQADAITDEMLYRQIAASPDLRANITRWLLARGYTPEDDLRGTSLEVEGSLGSGDGSSRDASSFDPLKDGTGIIGSSNADPSLPVGLNVQPSRGPTDRVQSGTNDAGKPSRNITDEPDVRRVTAPYNLRSLRDLYTQLPQDTDTLKRFGSDVFLRRSEGLAGSAFGTRQMPIDLPVGPDYVIGVGDGITINLSGGISQTLNRVVDREGKILVPEAGPVVVAGMTLQQSQTLLENTLQKQFRNAHVDVTIARLRTVRVYVVGDVQRPGAYDLSSLSTPLNGLYAAGGPTAVGSLRTVRHYRGKQLIREIDLYDFLLHGVRTDEERLQSGDTLLIPPSGPQVAVSGMVKRPAIYELKGETSLSAVLDDAGGATVAAALEHIKIDRITPNSQRESLSISAINTNTPDSTTKALDAFAVKDGDRIHVASILPYNEKVIYLEGHVARPGKYPYQAEMRIADVIHTYQDLLPEPATRGAIIRLMPPDLHPETLSFDVPEVLIGNGNLALQPFDTIRIFGRYEVDAPQVAIRGEVLKPGTYALSSGMTASQLVKMAGGFKRDALMQSADLTSYTIKDEMKVVSQRSAIPIGDAVNHNRADLDVPLKPGDVLTIHQISGWNDIGASIVLQGEVNYPGSYGLQEGERLSSVLRRAGGFRDSAYPAGAILVRSQVRELEEKSRDQLIHQIETTSASARLSPNLTGQDQSATLQAVAQQQNEVLQRLRNQPASGRLVIHVSADIESWANTPADIEMRSGDQLAVPKRPGFVLVSGQTYNPSAITYVPGKDAAWYLRRAGGTNDVANRRETFIVRANGSVVGRRSGEWYAGNVLSTRLDPGDVIVVPQKIIGGSLLWRNLLTVAQITSSIAITAAVAGLF